MRRLSLKSTLFGVDPICAKNFFNGDGFPVPQVKFQIFFSVCGVNVKYAARRMQKVFGANVFALLSERGGGARNIR